MYIGSLHCWLYGFNEAADLSPRIGLSGRRRRAGTGRRFNEAADLSPRIGVRTALNGTRRNVASMRPRI